MTHQKEFVIAAFLSLIIVGSLGVVYVRWQHSDAPSEMMVEQIEEEKEDADIVRIASTPYPPYYDEGLLQSGFLTELVRTAFLRAGIETEVDFFPWERTLAAANNGTHDVILTMWKTPEREETYVFSSQPLPANELVMFAMADAGQTFDGLATIEDAIVATISGYSYNELLNSYNVTVDETESLEQNFKKLVAGRVDFVIEDKGVGLYTLETAMPESKDDIIIVGDPIQIFDQYLTAPKTNERAQEIINAFDTAYAQLLEDETYNTILQRHGFLDAYGVFEDE